MRLLHVGARGVDDAQVVDALKNLAGFASVYDVTILVETEADYADTARLARVLDAVDSPNVGALWDLQHPWRLFGEEPETTCATATSRTPSRSTAASSTA